MNEANNAILIMDRNPDLLKALREVLENRDYRVYTAQDQSTAGAIIITHNIELVLLGFDGDFDSSIKFLQNIRSIQQRASIIIMARKLSREQVMKCYMHGAFDFITQPIFDAKQLLHILDKARNLSSVPLTRIAQPADPSGTENEGLHDNQPLNVLKAVLNFSNKNYREDDLIIEFVRIMQEFICCSYVTLLFLHEEGERLYIRYTNLPETGSAKSVQIPYPSHPFAHAMIDNQAALLSDLPREIRSIVSGSPEIYGEFSDKPRDMRSIVFPLKLREKPFGFILFSGIGEEPVLFRENLELLEVCTTQFVLSLEVMYLEELANRRYLYNLNTGLKFLEHGNSELKGHSERVTQFCMEIAAEINLDEREKLFLRESALLHDIGKLYADSRGNDHILRGARLIASIGLEERVQTIIKQIHEHYDGTGYPHGLKGKNILVEARILAIANEYDRLLQSRQTMRDSQPRSILAELENGSGNKFDPEILRAFMNILREKRFTHYERSGLLRFLCKSCGNEIVTHAQTIENKSVNHCEICGKDFRYSVETETVTRISEETSWNHSVQPMDIDDGELRLKILLVDDHPHFRKALNDYLTKKGYEIYAAAGGTESLAITREIIPDLILLDLLMHPISGIDLCKIFRKNEQFAEIPIIFLSASDDPGVLSKLCDFTHIDYIQKPFSLEELLNRIKLFLPEKAQLGGKKTLDNSEVN